MIELAPRRCVNLRGIHRRSLLSLLALGLAFPSLGLAKKRDKKKGGSGDKEQARKPLGVLAGTVFSSDGRSIPGAEVSAVNEANPKLKAEGRSDARGEFAFRLPSGVGPYRVRAEAKGFQPGEKTAEVFDSQKTNINLLLSPP